MCDERKGRFFTTIEGSQVKANRCCAYCLRKRGMMTKQMMEVHKCVEKGCRKCILFDYVDNPGSVPERERMTGDEYRKNILKQK